MSDFKLKKYRLLAVLIVCLLITAYMPINSHAFCLFQSDYDNDEWVEEKIVYEIPEGIDHNWLPLRDVSEHLPITVDWDAATKEIIVKSDLYVNSTNLLKEKRYQIDKLYCYEDLIVVNGVTYCSPRFLTTRLPHVSFRYNGELYYFKGETKTSKLVHGEDAFRKEVLTTMYNIKLALPEDYNLIRSCLTGGIEQKIMKSDIVTYNAYIYPTTNRPIAYIVNWKYSDVSYLIAHEAYHVWLEHNARQSEKLATEYGQKVSYDLREMAR